MKSMVLSERVIGAPVKLSERSKRDAAAIRTRVRRNAEPPAGLYGSRYSQAAQALQPEKSGDGE